MKDIADELNRLGIRTGRGSHWYASTVRLQLHTLLPMAHDDATSMTSRLRLISSGGRSASPPPRLHLLTKPGR